MALQPLRSKKNKKARLSFARKHLDDPQDFWENTLWTDETKVELFGRCASHYIWRKSNSVSEKAHHKTVKYGLGLFCCFRTWKTCCDKRNHEFCCLPKHPEEQCPVQNLKLKRTWVLQQDNDPKHTSKSTSERLKKN